MREKESIGGHKVFRLELQVRHERRAVELLLAVFSVFESIPRHKEKQLAHEMVRYCNASDIFRPDVAGDLLRTLWQAESRFTPTCTFTPSKVRLGVKADVTIGLEKARQVGEYVVSVYFSAGGGSTVDAWRIIRAAALMGYGFPVATGKSRHNTRELEWTDVLNYLITMSENMLTAAKALDPANHAPEWIAQQVQHAEQELQFFRSARG